MEYDKRELSRQFWERTVIRASISPMWGMSHGPAWVSYDMAATPWLFTHGCV